jgi:hypothetical protein
MGEVLAILDKWPNGKECLHHDKIQGSLNQYK